jgi:asparagine synthase (glutamine-hydrolysing)
MPGLSLCYAPDPALDPGDPAWERALGTTRCETPCEPVTLFRDDRVRIGASAHAGYPLETFESPGAFACLEGRTYGVPASRVLAELLEAVEAPSAERDDPTDALLHRSRAWDGDFVAVVVHRARQRVIVLGDPMGRLPLYVRTAGGRLLVTRDQRFALALSESRAPDRLGLALLLLFGFPLGSRTLIEEVACLPPGAALAARPGGFERRESAVGGPGLEEKSRAGRSLRRNAADLADLFVEACRLRARAVDPILLGLSGGLDSRAVAAALARVPASFEAVTFADAAGIYEHELGVARRVAAAVGAPWHELRLAPPSGERLGRLLRAKLGLNTLAMAFGFEYFDRLHRAWGPRRSYWSGDGGDKALPDHRPRLGARQRADVARYLVDKHRIWPLEWVSRLTGLPEHALVDEVRAVIDRYPERDPDQRCVRFLLAERARRWILEGEDTNRHHYWTVAPFEAPGFLEAAMACPDGQKSGHRLYREFLRNLSPAATRIEDANLGLATSSPLYVWNRRARELSRRFPGLQRRLSPDRGASAMRPRDALLRDLLTRQREGSAAVRAAFSAGALADVAANPARWSGAALEGLITAASAVEEIAEDRSTLDAFADTSFG